MHLFILIPFHMATVRRSERILSHNRFTCTLHLS